MRICQLLSCCPLWEICLSLSLLLTSLFLVSFSFPTICLGIGFVIVILLGDHYDFWIWKFISFISSQNFQLLSLWILTLPHSVSSLLILSSGSFSFTLKKIYFLFISRYWLVLWVIFSDHSSSLLNLSLLYSACYLAHLWRIYFVFSSHYMCYFCKLYLILFQISLLFFIISCS